MNIVQTRITGLIIVEPRLYPDDRGYFYESFNAREYTQFGLDMQFVQDNQSKSSYGVIRGLHYQINPYAQTKLVRVLEGKIFDVAVDLREGSSTFGKWHGEELSADNMKQMLIPKGFAHGFSVLSPTAVVFYKCDAYYSPEYERGIRYNDPFLDIKWQIEPGKIIVSERDLGMPSFDEAEKDF